MTQGSSIVECWRVKPWITYATDDTRPQDSQKIHKSRNAAPHHFGQLELPQEILPASGRDLFDLRAALKTVANFH